MTTARERLDTLLVDEATGSLNEAERAELAALLAEYPDVDRYAFERAAAAVFLAIGGTEQEPMPARLSSRLMTDAEQTLRNRD